MTVRGYLMFEPVTLECDYFDCKNVLQGVKMEGHPQEVLYKLDIGWWSITDRADDRLHYIFCPDHGTWHRHDDHYCAEDRCSGYWANIELVKEVLNHV